jgi:protein disulfide-isomerase A6
MLNNVAVKYKDRPFSYLWAEGGSQPKLEAAFEVGGYGYPALIALNPADGKFTPLKSAFEPQPLVQFVEGLRQVRAAQRSK